MDHSVPSSAPSYLKSLEQAPSLQGTSISLSVIGDNAHSFLIELMGRQSEKTPIKHKAWHMVCVGEC